MSCTQLSNRLFSRSLPFNWEEIPDNAFLVGGAVRDALLNRQKDYIDLDFVIGGDSIEIARTIANRHRAGFVILDREREIARVVFETGTLDFARMEGASLENDLQRRDFTVNALAYAPKSGSLIDPLGGLTDLKNKSLRMISKKNLQDDPLRLLRAYRQAAQLDFTIEPLTRMTIAYLADSLNRVAAERVQSELNYLLLNANGSQWLKAAWEDGLFRERLSSISAAKIDRLLEVEKWARYLETYGDNFKFAPTELQIAKLALLVSPFPEAAESELENLKYSRAEIRAVLTSLKNLYRLDTDESSLKDRYFLFLEIGKIFPVFALFAVAYGLNADRIGSLLRSYLDPTDPVAHPRPLLTGKELIGELKIKPGPTIGLLLTRIQLAHIEGKVNTYGGAIDLAREILREFN